LGRDNDWNRQRFRCGGWRLRSRFRNIISGSLFGRKGRSGGRGGDGRWRRGLTDRRLGCLGSGGRCSLSGYNLGLSRVIDVVIGLNRFLL
jgi:hypothetical protein